MGEKSCSDAAWKKGEKSASVLSGNDGMAAAVLSLGLLVDCSSTKIQIKE